MHGRTTLPVPTVAGTWWRGRYGLGLVREVATMGALFLLYRQIRHLTRDQLEVAMANAWRVVQVERTLGMFNERAVQRFALASPPVVRFLDRYYVSVHFLATGVFLVWAYLWRPAAYRRMRAAYVVVTAAGLLGHVVFPLAPPRLLPELGIVDTLARFGPRIYAADPTRSFANQFAAMPSLHFGWAVLVAVGVCSAVQGRRRFLGLVHPVVTLVAIVATGNHYWIDAAVAGVLVTATMVAIDLPRRAGVRETIELVPAVAGSSGGGTIGVSAERTGMSMDEPCRGSMERAWGRSSSSSRPSSPVCSSGGRRPPPSPGPPSTRPRR